MQGRFLNIKRAYQCKLARTQAGNYITEELVTTVVQMITQTEDLHAYVTQRLFVAIQDDIAKVSGCTCWWAVTEAIKRG